MNTDVFIHYFLATAIIVDASIAWFVLLKNPRRAVNQTYFAMILCVTLWQVTTFILSYYAVSGTFAELLLRVSYISLAFLSVSVLYFVSIFPNQQHRPEYMTLLVPVAVCFAVATSFGWVVNGIRVQHDVVSFAFGWFYPVYVLIILAALIFSLAVVIYRWYEEKDDRARVQFQYLLLGLAIPITFGSFTNFFLPFMAFLSNRSGVVVPTIHNFGVASTLFLSMIVAYAVVRHRLLHMNILIQRSAVAVLMVVAAFAVGLGALLVLKDFWPYPEQGPIQFIIFGVAVLVLLAVLRPSAKLFERLLKRLIKREVIDLYKASPYEMNIFEMTENPEKCARAIAAQLLREIPVEHLVVVAYNHHAKSFEALYPSGMRKAFDLAEEWLQAIDADPSVIALKDVLTTSSDTKKTVKKQMRQFNAQYLIPLKPYDRLVGALFVGQKITGQSYTASDLANLKKIQQSAGIMLWSVLQMHHAVRTSLERELNE